MPFQPSEPPYSDTCQEAYYDLARNQIEKLAEKIADNVLCPSTDSPEVPDGYRTRWEALVCTGLNMYTTGDMLPHIAHGYGLIPSYETFAQDWTERWAEDAWRGER